MLRITWRWVLGVLPLLYLWGLLINHLRVPWSPNPQYAYGWSVPFLCVYLLWERMSAGDRRSDIGDGSARPASAICQPPSFVGDLPTPIFYLLFALCALLYAPTRLI